MQGLMVSTGLILIGWIIYKFGEKIIYKKSRVCSFAVLFAGAFVAMYGLLNAFRFLDISLGYMYDFIYVAFISGCITHYSINRLDKYVKGIQPVIYEIFDERER